MDFFSALYYALKILTFGVKNCTYLKFRIEKKNNLVQVKIFLGRMDTSHSYSLINIFPIVL